MNNDPVRLSELISTSGAQRLNDEFAEFSANAEITDEEQQRILSSVMRKAGAEMKETMTTKKTRRHSRRFVGFMIAAAIAVTGAAGVYAYNQFFHKENVEHYIKNGEQLEERGLAANIQAQTDDLRFTVDTLLSDGHQAYGVLTVEHIGDKAGQALSLCDYAVTIVYADTGEFITNNWGGDAYIDGTEKAGQNRRIICIDLSGVDTQRDVKFLFRRDEPTGSFYGSGTLTGQKDNNDIPIRYECEATASLRKNVENIDLYDSEGRKVTLSEFEIYSSEVMWEDTSSTKNALKLIDKDGNKTDCTFTDITGYMETYSYITFNKLVNTDDISGVEINGIEYLK